MGGLPTFNALTGTPLARLHMPEKHLENARLMAAGLSVRVTAERLGVSVPTAFKWRHRFLQAPLNQQPGTLSGLVETDETYILESFKGQRGGLPRPPKKRGTPGRTRGLGPDQIPVLVAREREMKGTLTARIPTRSAASIAPVLAGRVVPDAVLVSDSAKAYRKVAKALNVSLMQVPANAKHKTQGTLHINNANAYCSRLDGWLVSQEQRPALVCSTTKSLMDGSLSKSALLTPKQWHSRESPSRSFAPARVLNMDLGTTEPSSPK